MARVEDDRLILERPDALLERAKARFASIADGASLADELVAERRRESESERHPS